MDQKNQYSEKEYTTQSNLQIQCNPYQATSHICHRTRTNNFKICMEIQKTSNSQSNLEKEEWNWRNQPAWLQAILQSYSHQDSMVLAQRQKYRSMEQNRKPRDKSTHLWTPLEKAMATHSFLAWKTPWTEELWRAAVHRVVKSQTRLSNFTFTFHFLALEKEMATHSSVLAWRIPGTMEPGGLLSMGLHRVRHDWSDLAAAADR